MYGTLECSIFAYFAQMYTQKHKTQCKSKANNMHGMFYFIVQTARNNPKMHKTHHKCTRQIIDEQNYLHCLNIKYKIHANKIAQSIIILIRLICHIVIPNTFLSDSFVVLQLLFSINGPNDERYVSNPSPLNICCIA